MEPLIYIINASSRKDTGITDDLARSLLWLRGPNLPRIECVTLEDGPNGISTARDSDDAAPAVLRFVEREAQKSEVGAFVIACFSDPGVHSARELTRKPIIGIGEAGIMAALSFGDRVGTIGVSKSSPAANERFTRRLGVQERVAGHLAIALDYGQLKDEGVVTDRLIEAGRRLRDEYAANVLVFAGAGMGRYVKAVQTAVSLPVVDPTQVAAGLAIAQFMQLHQYCVERFDAHNRS